ncbi:MAG TPA: phosphotransferase family protein [Rhizomicrobium sp.]|jgi:aminoglycoside phosphotransferase (APT) family kinase protein|nr:phosphotransferase family protein [Rhizomicrobium sp.]
MSETIAAALEAYLRKRLFARDLQVCGLERIHGGASRETYRFLARYGEGERQVERKLILRRDPPASLIETDRAREFRAYEAFHALGLPVPEPVLLEPDGGALERPFFIMSEIEDAAAASVLAPDPYGPQRDAIGLQFWSVLGRIARADPIALDLGDFDGSTERDACWRNELARWERVIDADEDEPQPIVRAAIRWLKRRPPAPAQKISLVHGDYRSGNFLWSADGGIRAILDWEMAHLGDPLEDLGWALDPLWAHHDPSRPGGMLPRAEAIAIWERESGLIADSDALRWWEIFASVKGAAIWISAAHEFATGRNDDPVNAFSGWYCLAFHNKLLADRLEALA